MNVLVIDSYDSFTYNLCQQIGALGAEPVVVKSDTPYDAICRIDCERIVLSPGPGRPEDSAVYMDVCDGIGREIPTLGVCLGHQAIGHAFGASVVRADAVVHGRTSPIDHDRRGVFAGLERPFSATRYHSLVLAPETIPGCLEITAFSLDDGCIMGVRHRRYPITGVQFHPESILTRQGNRIMANFLGAGGCG
ncbi:MAG: aminodeoxychorismate/anthranilate synthase component II [Methanomicrobiales archaeon]|nr:aminodeoxychorismate/anthranilate synthase component II [Methanomicrobiales archaeon]